MDELLTQGLTAMLPSSQASARSVCFATNRLARTVRPDDATTDPSSGSALNAAAAELLHVFTDVFKFKSSEIIALVIQTRCVEVDEFRAATTSQSLSQIDTTVSYTESSPPYVRVERTLKDSLEFKDS